MFTKIKSLFVIMLLMFAFVPVVFADSNETGNYNSTIDGAGAPLGDDEVAEVVSEEEANILSVEFGAQVRMLQLQNRLEAQAESGQLIIDRINEVKPDFDTSRLDEIVDEFYTLIGLIEEYDYNQDKEVMVNDFVSMKKQSIDLSNEFKTIAKDSLSESDKEALRERAQEKKQEWNQKQNQKLNQFKNQYNLKKVEGLALKLGYDVEKAKKGLAEGNLTIEQVKNKLVDDYSKLNPEKKKEIQDALKETRIKNNIEVKERKQEMIAKAEARRAEFKAKTEALREEFKAKTEARRAEIKAKNDALRKEIQARNNINTQKDELNIKTNNVKDDMGGVE